MLRPTVGSGLVISWAGMRGIVSLAAALALPSGFPYRNLIVLTAFSVVLGTLIIQGLTLKPLGGLTLEVDGASVDISDTLAYRAWMLSGVPNFGFCFGYSNNSWTLRADLSARYLTRLLGHMSSHGYSTAIPTPPAGMERKPFLDLTSGYVQRGIGQFPKSGTVGPWVVTQNYVGDVLAARRANVAEDITFRSSSKVAANA